MGIAVIATLIGDPRHRIDQLDLIVVGPMEQYPGAVSQKTWR